MRNVNIHRSHSVRHDRIAGAATAQQKKPAEAAVQGPDRNRGDGLRKRTGRLLPGRDARRWPHPGLSVCPRGQAQRPVRVRLFDAAAQLERAVAALAYLVNECGDDLDRLLRGRTGR
jgi:hypothetical protein